MNNQQQLKKIKQFIQDHFGISITDNRIVAMLLQNEGSRKILQESIKTSKKEQQQYQTIDHGYDYSDNYYKRKPQISHQKPHIHPLLLYIQLFKDELAEQNEQNPFSVK